MEKRRIEDVDFIKGIMIFLMVCFHINVGALSNITSWIYSFHMPVFLFYSGYFVSTSKPVSERLYTLLRTLVVPYVIFEIIYVLMLYVAGQLGVKFSNRIESFDVYTVFYRVFVNPIGAYWYLHTLIVSLLIIYLGDFIKIKNLASKIIFIGIACFFLSFLLEGIKFENEIFIVLGYAFKIFSYDIYASLLSVVGIVLVFIYGDTVRGSVSSLGTSFFIISFLKYAYDVLTNTIFVKTFKYLGKNTLIIVVLHPIFLNGFKLLEKYFLQIDHTLILYSVINTSFTIALSLVMAVVFDKIKLSGLLFGRPIYVPYAPAGKA
nr:acyltransferase family protein [uncultured Flavobacterium sp.]